METADAYPFPHSLVRSTPEPESREARVLAALAEHDDGAVAFSGLRRRLGLHQQVLSRTLRRLEREGLVAHETAGYRATPQGSAAVRPAMTEPARPVLTLVHALLPPEVEAADVSKVLARRWFGGLRWYAESESLGETTLTWLTDEGGHVRVRVSAGALTVEAEPDEAGEPAFPPLRALVAAVADIYAAGPSRAS